MMLAEEAVVMWVHSQGRASIQPFLLACRVDTRAKYSAIKEVLCVQ